MATFRFLALSKGFDNSLTQRRAGIDAVETAIDE
ncbi:hypothetical protein AEYBE204_03855 [Asticcacaulis sp. YBE204]|nr:hypothetical protein AEYBE204_03855 [Asticcacaulis sp. YBE204]